MAGFPEVLLSAAATILHAQGPDHTQLTYRHQGRDYRLTDVSGTVKNQLFE